MRDNDRLRLRRHAADRSFNGPVTGGPASELNAFVTEHYTFK